MKEKKKTKEVKESRFQSAEVTEAIKPVKTLCYLFPKHFYTQTIPKELMVARHLSDYDVKLVDNLGNPLNADMYSDTAIRKNARIIHKDEEYAFSTPFIGIEIELSLNENIWALRSVKWALDNMIKYKFDKYVNINLLSYDAIKFKMDSRDPDYPTDDLLILRNYIIYNAIIILNKTCPIFFRPAHEDASGVEICTMPLSQKAYEALVPEFNMIFNLFSKLGFIANVENNGVHTHLSHTVFGKDKESQRVGLKHFLWFIYENDYAMGKLSQRKFQSSLWADVRYLTSKDASMHMDKEEFKKAFVLLKDEILDGFLNNNHINSNLNIIVNQRAKGSSFLNPEYLETIEYRWWATTNKTKMLSAYVEFFYAFSDYLNTFVSINSSYGFYYTSSANDYDYTFSSFYKYITANKPNTCSNLIDTIEELFPEKENEE